MGHDEIRRLYQQHGSALLGYARAVLNDHPEAEDVLHEVFLKLVRDKISPNDPAPYLFRAVRNACLNFRRHDSRNVAITDQDSWFETTDENRDLVRSLQIAIQDVPEDQREIIIMHVWGEMTFDQIARVLDISPNTAASRYRYGLTKLRSVMQPGG